MTASTPMASLRWPIGLALLLSSGIAASLAFFFIAAQQPRELIGDGSWNAGSEYNADLQALETAQQRGWTLELRALPIAGGARVELLPATSAAPLPSRLELHLRRERPDRSDLDAELPLRPEGSHWVADVPLPLAGRWLLVARAGDRSAWVERRFALEQPP